MFPSSGRITRHPLPVFPSLHRVAAGPLPRLRRYYEGAVTSCRSSRRTSLSFVWRLPRSHSNVSLRNGRVPPPQPGVGHPVSPAGSVPWKRQDLPRSWGTLMCLCHVLRPRQDQSVRPYDGPVLPPLCPQRRLPQKCISRLNHTASALAVFRFAVLVTQAPRQTRFGCWRGSAGGIGYPLGSIERFPFLYFLYIHFLLSQAS
jgi:hypothetical protein